MLALRFGYTYYRSQQRPAYEAQMETLAAKNQALIKAIQADQEAQRAAGKTTVRADSAIIASDSTLRANWPARQAVFCSRFRIHAFPP